MCEFEYHYYDGCNHQVILLTDYCPQKLWRAAMDGQLWGCPEEIYDTYLTGICPVAWEFMSGHCWICQEKYNIPATGTYPPMSASFHGEQGLAACMAVPRPPPSQDPYISIPRLQSRITDMLGTCGPYSREELSWNSVIVFPGETKRFWRYPDSEFQFLSQGRHKGIAGGPAWGLRDDQLPVAGSVISPWSLRGGMAMQDMIYVANIIDYHSHLTNLYNLRFEPRGMPYDAFWGQVYLILNARREAKNISAPQTPHAQAWAHVYALEHSLPITRSPSLSEDDSTPSPSDLRRKPTRRLADSDEEMTAAADQASDISA